MKKVFIIVLIILLGTALVIIPNMKGSTDNSFEVVYLNNKNLAMPDLTGGVAIAPNVFRIYNLNGITVDYNLKNGEYIINGLSTLPSGIRITNDFLINGTYTYSFIYIFGNIDGILSTQFYSALNPPYDFFNIYVSSNSSYQDIQRLENITGYINIFIPQNTQLDNFIFKLQFEKGSTATTYVVPKLIPVYKDNLTYKEKQDIGIGAFTGITNIIKTIDNIVQPITNMFNSIIDFFN